MYAVLPEVKGGKLKFRQLFFNGQRQIRSRYPNYDADEPLYGGWAFIEEAIAFGTEKPNTIRYEQGMFPRRWAKPEQGEMVVFPWLCWMNDLIRIAGTDQKAKKLPKFPL